MLTPQLICGVSCCIACIFLRTCKKAIYRIHYPAVAQVHSLIYHFVAIYTMPAARMIQRMMVHHL